MRRKCPKCNSKKNVFTVLHILIPPMTNEQLKTYHAYIRQKKSCFGPKDKNFYCEKCDLYFN